MVKAKDKGRLFSLRTRTPVLSVQEEMQSKPVKPQKILVVAHNHPELYPGGGEILAYELFKSYQAQENTEAVFLAATGNVSRTAHVGTAFLSMNGRADEFLFHSDQFSYFYLSHKNPQILSGEFKQFLIEQAPDIIHFHHILRVGIEVLSLVKKTLPDTKIFLTLHDYIAICQRDGQMVRKQGNELCTQASPQRCHECFTEYSPVQFKLREQLIKTHFALVDRFISPSEFLANCYREWGLPAEKIKVIANATRQKGMIAPHTLGEEAQPMRFAYFGQISVYKGLMVLLDAVELLRKQGHEHFSLAIHGNLSTQSEHFREIFLQKVEALNAQVTFYGRYQSEEMTSLMQQADWVVVPSIWWENSPLVIAESFRHQRPVLCSAIGGMAELVEDGVTGLHFAPSNPHALAETMARAMQNRELWQRLCNHILPAPNIDAVAQEYRNLFSQHETVQDMVDHE